MDIHTDRPQTPDSSATINVSEAHFQYGAEDGENSALGCERDESSKHPTGTDGSGDNNTKAFDEEDDHPLRVPEVLERFRQQTRTRLRDGSAKEYARAFRQLAKNVNLESYSRRQLSGPKGRMLILAHLDEVPKPSWRWVMAALKPVWTYGLNLPWPIDSKRDLPKLPRVRRRQSPPDAQVKTWARAMLNEKDLYLRVLWLLLAQHGWRPSHVCKMKWRNVQYDDQGKPVAIVADGAQESFKTCSPVATRLAPDVADALIEWHNTIVASPDQPILPWRSTMKKLDMTRVQDTTSFRKQWSRLQEKWNLPSMAPVHIRHWVATASRRAGLSRQATAFMMGHDATQGGSMTDFYDCPQLQDVFDEQAARLPYGPLGLLDPPTVELEGGLSKEVVSLVSAYLAGQTGTMEFATTMEKVRLQRSTQQSSTIET